MSVDACIDQVMHDERLTYGLADPEARLLIEWLVERAEWIPQTGLAANDQELAWVICYRRAKVLRQVVSLWCYRGRPDAAIQLAASEGLAEYLPAASVEDALDIMQALMKQEPFHVMG